MAFAGQSAIGCCWLALVVAFALPARAQTDTEEIRVVLNTMFDRPDSKVQIEPVVVVGSHAIAGWTQGNMGGRALLRRHANTWTLVLCAGDAIKAKGALIQAGLNASDAALMEHQLSASEAGLPPERRQMLSRFEGIVMGHHGPAKH